MNMLREPDKIPSQFVVAGVNRRQGMRQAAAVETKTPSQNAEMAMAQQGPMAMPRQGPQASGNYGQAAHIALLSALESRMQTLGQTGAAGVHR